MPDVAIVGTGQTDHKSRREDVNIPELVREAVDRALADGGVTFAEIDAVCFGNMDLFEGLAENEHWLASAFGAGGQAAAEVQHRWHGRHLDDDGRLLPAQGRLSTVASSRSASRSSPRATRRGRSRPSATRSGSGR